MTAAAALRVGWCPGALRPMASGDGLIVRVKPRAGGLTPEQARGIGGAALRHGSGDLDLTSRANLQIRGVTDAGLPALTAALDGLQLLDASAEAEAVRNVVSSPLAGLDPTAAFDIGPAVAALEARLAVDPTMQALPAKFGFVVDDGGRFGLRDTLADIRFEADAERGGPWFAVRLGRCLDRGAPAGPARAVGAPADRGERMASCAPGRLADAAAALAGVFITARRTDERLRHMDDLVLAIGAAAVFARAGLPSSCRRAPDGLPTRPGRTSGTAGLVAKGVLAIAAPFGRLTASQWLALTEAAGREAASGLRVAPWRSVLIPGLAAPAAARVAAAAAAAGLIAEPSDPRLAIAACPGAPGCRRGTTPVLDHAAALAARLGPGRAGPNIRLHVSGCGKGCAHRGEAPVTLVGHDGLYDLVLAGKAGAEPWLRDLSVEQAARRIEVWSRGEPRL